uniref:RING-type E3 ubiquitin transferase n=1 Tax=Meleagris gallopavo TaxID=9103 RepID=A0A803YF46_MELGA
MCRKITGESGLSAGPCTEALSMEAALDTRCPVCLDNWDSAAYAMPCCHQFCFPCIQRWTSTRPQCPLCKQGVRSIIHTTGRKSTGQCSGF